MSDERVLEALGRSDKKFAQVNDGDITDSEGGVDSDFEPKVTETKDKKKLYNKPKTSIGLSNIKPNVVSSKEKIKIKNRNRRTSSVRSQSRTPPSMRTPKRKATSLVRVSENQDKTYSKGNVSNQNSGNGVFVNNNLLSLQQNLNKMLTKFTAPIPTILRRVCTTYITSDRRYQAPTEVLLKFLLDAAIYEIPTRTTPVRDINITLN